MIAGLATHRPLDRVVVDNQYFQVREVHEVSWQLAQLVMGQGHDLWMIAILRPWELW